MDGHSNKGHLDETVYSSITNELVLYVWSMPNQIFVRIGQQKFCSNKIKIM
jgi:hypothetical protein